MGFDYEIQCKSGSKNLAGDALSKVQGFKLLILAMTVVTSDLHAKIKASYLLDVEFTPKLNMLQQGETITHYSMVGGLLKRKNRIVVGTDEQLRSSIISWHHGSFEVGHIGKDATIMRVKRFFYWRNMVKHIRQFIRKCTICQSTRYEPLAYLELLQPPPIPSEV